MTSELIYDAHDDDEPVDLADPVDDPMLVRNLLIELQRGERKAALLRSTMASILGTYQARIDRIEERERAIRESLEIYVERNGPVSFPDVGGVTVAHRKPSVKIVEPEAFAAWLIKRGQSGQVSVDQKYTFGTTAKKSAVAAIREGEVAPGCEVVPASTNLVIRKAE